MVLIPVKMGMVHEVLSPGMEQGGDAQLGPESFASELEQRGGGGVEEEAVEQSLILENQRTEDGRKREDPVVVAHREERLALGLQPLLPTLPLAIRTMPIPASEGSPMRGSAKGALPQRPPDAAGVAVTETTQDVEGVRGLGIQTAKLRKEASKDGSHGGTVFYRSPAPGRLHQRLGWRSVRISPRGLLTCPMRS
jgi:hypothetical protein